MKIKKISSLLLLLEFIYALYKTIPPLIEMYEPTKLIAATLGFLIIILLLVSSIGIFLDKKWGVIVLWIFIILPFVVPWYIRSTVYLFGYHTIVINTVIATYLTTVYWPKKKQQIQ